MGLPPKDLGCLGEIKIAEDEDYSKWAIKILVAFRDKEALTELTAQRQSGGVSPISSFEFANRKGPKKFWNATSESAP